MTMFLVISLAGAGSYLLRVLPLLLADRLKLSPRLEELLGYAVVSAMTALLVASLLAMSRQPVTGHIPAATPWIAVAVAAIVALTGRSLTLIVASGAFSYAVIAALLT